MDFDVKIVVHLRLGHLEWNQWDHLKGDIKVGSQRITTLLMRTAYIGNIARIAKRYPSNISSVV
jgi:hypothetical protein